MSATSSTLKFVSPQSESGSLVFSVLAHAAIYGVMVAVLSFHLTKSEPKEDYVDLGYQTFDEPPPQVPVERRVAKAPEPEAPVDKNVKPDNSPKELQDEKGEVAGTQTAKQEASPVGATTNLGNAESTPFYKIKPKYPKAAAIAGVEGYVLFQIDINEQGEVENIRVIGGEQRNMFQTEARRAVAQWKYKPFTDPTGKPIRKVDHQVKVEFKLQEIAQGESTTGS